MNLKKLGTYLRVNLLGLDPRLIKKEFTGPRSHKGWETLLEERAFLSSTLNNSSVFQHNCPRSTARFVPVSTYPADTSAPYVLPQVESKSDNMKRVYNPQIVHVKI